MRTRFLLAAACLSGAKVVAQPYLFFNRGALVHIQQNALVYVQGGMDIRDEGTNNGVVNNLGTIELRDGSGNFQGSLLINPGAELNSYQNSNIYLERHYHNDRGFHRSTGSDAIGIRGGTLHFVGRGGPQDFRISVDNNINANPQAWTLNNVVVAMQNSVPLSDRHVRIENGTDRDMWIAGTLTLTQGRILTEGRTLSAAAGEGPAEVRILSDAPGAVDRGAPAGGAPDPFSTLYPANREAYVQGYLRRNVTTGQSYQFPVGGAEDSRGIQRIDVQPSVGNHYVRVRFIPVVNNLSTFGQPAYCRPPDNATRQYLQLNNGYWEVMPFSAVDATAPASGTQAPSSVTMYNRVVTNATPTGNCPNQGATTGLPGGPDPVWTHYPSNRCYVGYNRSATGTGELTPPNNCQGSDNGWTVTRDFLLTNNFTAYNQNGSYEYGTVVAWNAPLPSDDIRLSAHPAGSAIALTWEVTPEREHVLGYNLERSTDGVSFTHIAQIDRQGRTVYHHRDEYVQLGVRYFYRVSQHDVFGQVRYSNTVEATLPKASQGEFEVHLHPQPFTGEGYLQVSLPNDGVVAMQVYDAAGRLVLQQSYNLTAGIHRIDLSGPLSQVAPGNYNAVFTFGERSRTLRMIKAAPSQ